MTRCNQSWTWQFSSRTRFAIKQYNLVGPWRDDEVSGWTIDEGRECGLPCADDSDPGRCVIAAGVRRRNQFLEDPSIHSRHTAHVVVCVLASCGPGDGEGIEGHRSLSERVEAD